MNWWYTEHDDTHEFRDSSNRPHFMQCLKDATFKMFIPSTLNQFIVMKMPKTLFFQPCNGKHRKGILNSSEFQLKLEDPTLNWEVNDYEISGSDWLSNRCLKQSNQIFIYVTNRMQLLRDEKCDLLTPWGLLKIPRLCWDHLKCGDRW